MFYCINDTFCPSFPEIPQISGHTEVKLLIINPNTKKLISTRLH